jgi:uncharacterized protein YfdQ (DUF2303 family)
VGSVRPDGEINVVSLERHSHRPLRRRGSYRVHNAESFARAVGELADPDQTARVYADAKTATIAAVLNDHSAVLPGWGDLQVILTLERTRCWEAWRSNEGNMRQQLEFATHVEENLASIQSPPAADLLEVCQNLEGTVSAKFRSGSRLRDGSRQFQWSEEVDAGGGHNGEMIIPHDIAIHVALFEGSEPITVSARLRFRIQEGHLRLGYAIPEMADLERGVFDVTVDALDVNLPVIRGLVPTGRV